MSEQTPTPEAEAELVTLRKLRDELLTSKNKQKAKIDELESQLLQANERVTSAEANVQELTINGPLKAMAEVISKTPGTFLDVFHRTYKLTMSKDGELTLLHARDDKPVLDEKDKAIPFERGALVKLLLADKDPAALAFYQTTLLIPAATGGADRTIAKGRSPFANGSKSEEPKVVAPAFGLR